MTVCRLRSLPLIIVLALCLLTAQTSAFGYVWCVGEDGHAALETALADACDTGGCASPAENLPATGFSDSNRDCGPCLDISPSPRWDSSRSRQDDIVAGLLTDLAPGSVAARILPSPRLLNPHRIVDFSPRLSEPILQHRTIVLLI